VFEVRGSTDISVTVLGRSKDYDWRNLKYILEQCFVFLFKLTVANVQANIYLHRIIAVNL
jgi:hypothetical protein